MDRNYDYPHSHQVASFFEVFSHENFPKIRITGTKYESNKINTTKRIHFRKNLPPSQVLHQNSIQNKLKILPKSEDKRSNNIPKGNTSLKDYRSLNNPYQNKDRHIELSKMKKIRMNSISNNKNNESKNQNIKNINQTQKKSISDTKNSNINFDINPFRRRERLLKPKTKKTLKKSNSGEKEQDIFNTISEILNQDKESNIDENTTVFSINQSDKPLILTEKIQVDWSPQLYELCHKCKDLFNFANFITRKIFFLYTNNKNVSWNDFLTIRENIMPNPTDKNSDENKYELLEAFDKLKNIVKYRKFNYVGNTLSTLIKYSKFYQDIGYAQSAQQINRRLGSNWQTFQTNLKKYYNGDLEFIPNIPHYKTKDGEFMMIYTSQDLRVKFNKFKQHLEETKRTTKYKNYSKTTAELLFPKRHRDFLPKIRVRYEILKKIREVRIIPKGSYYEIEIRYSKNSIDHGLNKNRALAIDLGVKNPMTIVNNFSSRPLLIQGRQLKHANNFINKKTPSPKSVISICKDILKKYSGKNNIKSILQILKERKKKYLEHFELIEDLIYFLRTNPELNYEEYIMNNKGNRKIEQIFNHIKALPNDEAKCGYFDYQEQEYNRKKKICEQISTQLNTISSSRHKKSIKKLLEKKQQKLNNLYKIYSNHIRNANHKLSRTVIDLHQQYDIGTIIIGYNEGWKTSSRLSKAINRKFIPLPFYKLINLIKYKAQLIGINVIVIDESYTSKCSSIDKEEIKFHEKYAGVREPKILGKDGISNKHYGQFYSYVSKKYIHSDVNGAFNIGRKGSPELFEDISQYQMLVQPKRIAIT